MYKHILYEHMYKENTPVHPRVVRITSITTFAFLVLFQMLKKKACV